MSSQASLRDLYNAPSLTWSFVPGPTPPSINASSSQVPSPSTPVFQWTTRPPTNSIFNLSPSLDLSDAGGINVTLLFRSLVASALLQYASTAIAMPWEVGKMLLQVQWVPRDASEVDLEPEIPPVEEDALSESSNDNEDSYFAEPTDAHSTRRPAPRPVDDRGYIIRRSILEEGTRPEYILPVGSADGVWGIIKRIGRFRGEGWLALWKGLLTSCIHDMLTTTLQPLFQSFLQSIFIPSSSPFHQPPVLLPVASHIITGFLLSPLDLIRTRLIVQSFLPRHAAYTGPIDALSQILRHEGGIQGIYLHPHLLIPTLLDSTLRPLVSFALPGLLAGYLGTHITEDANPIAWGLAELVGSCAGLLVTLPFETVRRRLQVQTRGTAKPIKACVEVRPAPYNGVVDTMWHILTEERSDLPLKRRRKRRMNRAAEKGTNAVVEESVDDREDEESWLKNTGIGQLYRGLGMRLGASVIVFVLALLSGGEDGDAGWAEL